MSYTTDLLDVCKKALKVSSDYGLAKALGLNPNAVSNYRSGASHADDRAAIILADAAGVDRLKAIARINADRAKKPEDRAFWKRIAAAAAVVLAVYTYVGATPARAAGFDNSADVVGIAHLFRTVARILRGFRSLFAVGGLRHGEAALC